MANIYWKMTKDTYKRYLEIFNELVESAYSEDKLRHEQAKDQLRALPGYPPNIHPDLDRVIPAEDDTKKIISTRSTN
jgi:hypothetical protein